MAQQHAAVRVGKPRGTRVAFALGVLNGAVGDYLARTHNPLATQMEILPGKNAATSSRVVVLIHGLMDTEAAWAFPDGGDYGSMLARDLGYTPRYLRYNTGLTISDNGAALSRALERLVARWPGKLHEILLLGHSMGGLVARAACHVASLQKKSAWLGRVRRAIYVGTPHLGAPLERIGRVVARVLQAVDDPYTQLIGEIANLRSDGIKDLGDADLRSEDRARRTHRLGLRDARHPVPLLPTIKHCLVAGTISSEPWLAELFGDSMVPVGSATNGLLTARILPGVLHRPLAHSPEVYRVLRAWCEETA